MNKNTDMTLNAPEGDETERRREALKKLGKYAVYAAPFTVMAVSAKAGTASGPPPTVRPGH